MNHLLVVHSSFHSLQGEGRFVGVPTVFLRLAGCNLACAWCDAREAAAGNGAERWGITETAARLVQSDFRDICITGGEPLLQEAALGELLTLLPPDRRVVIETNGSLSIASLRKRFPYLFFSVDWKPPSAGTTLFVPENLTHIGEYGWIKFVVADRGDLAFLAAHAPEAARHGVEIFVSPIFERGTAWMHDIAAAVLRLGAEMPIRLQVQMHKVIGVP